MGTRKVKGWVKTKEVFSDSEVLADLVKVNTLGWVVAELGPVQVQEWLEANYPYWDNVSITACLNGLDESHYPPAIVELLRDNQDTPWLTPNPLPG